MDVKRLGRRAVGAVAESVPYANAARDRLWGSAPATVRAAAKGRGHGISSEANALYLLTSDGKPLYHGTTIRTATTA